MLVLKTKWLPFNIYCVLNREASYQKGIISPLSLGLGVWHEKTTKREFRACESFFNVKWGHCTRKVLYLNIIALTI